MTTIGLYRKGRLDTGWLAAVTRRSIDIFVACAGLILLAPLVALISFAVWLEGGRPVFFSQVRLGKAGEPFPIYKFRKFGKDCGTDGCGVTVNCDHRMTHVGAILERTKLDELPQLWNILKGDMSFTGPRPESQKFAECFAGSYKMVLNFKPGIFGPSQFYFRDEGALYPAGRDPECFYREVLFPLKADIDLEYFTRRTLADDFRWTICCLMAVFGFRTTPTKTLLASRNVIIGYE